MYETDGLIDKGDFYNILDVLVRFESICFFFLLVDQQSRIVVNRLEGGDVALKDLNTFIMMVFEKSDKDKGMFDRVVVVVLVGRGHTKTTVRLAHCCFVVVV